jgi:hypothetical protein
MAIPNVDLNMSELPIIGGMFPDEATQRMQREMGMGARAYSAYRPEAYQARMNALRNRLSGYQGASNILTQMSGGNQPFDTASVQAPIFGPSMMQQGMVKGTYPPQRQPQQNPQLLTGSGHTPLDEYGAPVYNGARVQQMGYTPLDKYGAPPRYNDPRVYKPGMYNDPNTGTVDQNVYKNVVGDQPPWAWQPQNRRW